MDDKPIDNIDNDDKIHFYSDFQDIHHMQLLFPHYLILHMPILF